MDYPEMPSRDESPPDSHSEECQCEDCVQLWWDEHCHKCGEYYQECTCELCPNCDEMLENCYCKKKGERS